MSMEYGSTKYCIWKQLFQSKNIERGKITGKRLGYVKHTLRPEIDKKNYNQNPLHHTKITYQQLFLKNKDSKVAHPRPQTPQGEPVAKPGTLRLIILSLVCKSDIKSPLCIIRSVVQKRLSVGGNIQGRCINVETVLYPNISHIRHITNVNIPYRTTSVLSS